MAMGIAQRARSPTGRHQYNLNIKSLDLIGKGSFGYVYKSNVDVEVEEETLEQPFNAAIKFCLDPDEYTELDLLKLMPDPDPCILPLLYYFIWSLKDGKHVNLVFELFGEDLYEILTRRFSKQTGLGIYPEVFMYQCFRALDYLERQSIGHRDIKPENLLCKLETGELKITDFGCGKKLTPLVMSGHRVGTRYYMAPELLLGARKYGVSCDWWSAMCVLAELYLRNPLFYGYKTDQNQMARIKEYLGHPTLDDIREMHAHRSRLVDMSASKITHPGQGSTMSFKGTFMTVKVIPSSQLRQTLIDLLTNVLKYNPKKRLRPADVMKHKFFDRIKNPDIRLPNGKPLPRHLIMV